MFEGVVYNISFGEFVIYPLNDYVLACSSIMLVLLIIKYKLDLNEILWQLLVVHWFEDGSE